MTRRLQLLRLLLLGVLVLIAAAWLLFPPGENSASTSPASSAVAPEISLGAESAVQPPVSATPGAMRGAPAADIASSLAALADAGDGQAACRLSAELMRCRFLSRLDSTRDERTERNIARLHAAGKHDQARMIETMMEAMKAQLQTCRQLPAGLDQRALHYFRIAALAGNATQLLRYASGSGFESEGGYGYLTTPEFDQWRGEAEAAMQRALSQGQPAAAMALRGAYAGDFGIFAGLVADDDLQAYAYARLTEKLFGETLAAFPGLPARPPLSPADAQQAEALAAQWHQGFFKGQQFDLTSVMADSMWRPLYDDAPSHCGQAEGGTRG